jgi:DNA invertase Pin-like site-specific DNA recombinase
LESIVPRVNAVLYARKSSKEEVRAGETSKSVADQFTDMRAYAAAHSMNVVAELYDDAISGRQDDTRPGFLELRGLIEDGTANTIVLDTKSRLYRNSGKREMMMQDLDARGVQVHAVSQGGRIHRDTAHEWFVDGLDGLMDDRLWRERSEGWRKALARRQEKGLTTNGGPRFGYTKDEDKRYVPDPDTGPVLRALYLRYAAGAGFQGLCKWLNDTGVVTTRGNTWGTHSLIRALDSGFGAGLLISGKGKAITYSPGVHDGVITGEEWEAYLRARKGRATLPPKRKNPAWYLSGLVRCGLDGCGAPMLVNSYTDVKSQAICSAYKNRRTCAGVWVNRVAVEGAVAMWLGGVMDDLDAMAPTRDRERSAAQSTVDRLDADLTACQTALGRLAAALARDLMTEEEYRAARDELLGEQAGLEQRLAAARDELAALSPVDAGLYAGLVNAPEMTPGEWGALIGKVLRRVEVTKATYRFVPVVGEPVSVPR